MSNEEQTEFCKGARRGRRVHGKRERLRICIDGDHQCKRAVNHDAVAAHAPQLRAGDLGAWQRNVALGMRIEPACPYMRFACMMTHTHFFRT